MNDALFRPFTRRGRCEIPNCKHLASFQVSDRPNRPLLLLCEEHARALQSSVNSVLSVAYYKGNQYTDKTDTPAEAPAAEKPKKAEKKAEPKAEAKDTPAAEKEPRLVVPKPKASTEDAYVCKWCGESFPKSEMTTAQFMQHSKKCKKEHANAVSAD